MRRATWIALLCLSGCLGKNAVAPAAPPSPTPVIQHEAESIVFRPGPPNMPAGVEMAVLEGDPKAVGMFTLRLRAPAGFSLAPHTHPADERVTVLEGTISVVLGADTSRAQAKSFGPGSFYVNPAQVAHSVFSDAGAVVQITGQGPWRVEFLPMPAGERSR